MHGDIARRRGRRAIRFAFALLAVVLALEISSVAALAAQPPTTAAQDEFKPVDESKMQEQVPGAPLVMTAYAVAWIVIFGYVWSLWARLSKVEREIGEVSRRIDAGSRR